MRIIVGDAYCRVQGAIEEQAWLQLKLTVPTGDMTYKGGDKEHSFFKIGCGVFPKGLLPEVLAASKIDGHPIEVQYDATRMEAPSEPVPLAGITYFDYQDRAIREILHSRQGLVQVATNGGKTYIMEIFKQVKAEMEKSLASVGFLTSEKKDVEGRQFVLAMVKTFANRVGDHPDVTQLFDEHQVLLADEAHHLTAATWNRLFLMSRAVFKIGVSGTIPKSGTYKGMMVRGCTGPVLIDVRNKELIKRGISATPTILVVRMDHAAIFKGLHDRFLAGFCREHAGEEIFKPGGFRKWANAKVKMDFYREYHQMCMAKGVTYNERRNLRIGLEVRQRGAKECLIIVERVDHGHELIKVFRALDTEACFVHGEAKDRDELIARFKAGTLGVLISTQVLDEGVNISGIRLLVMASGAKAKRPLLQRIGRGLRRKKEGTNTLEVIDFNDRGNKYLEDYWRERLQLWTEEGFAVRKVK
jgi:superfamily II DNA or RNA helicase